MSDTNMKHIIATVTFASVALMATVPAGAQMEGILAEPEILKNRRTQTPDFGRSPPYRYTTAVTLGTSFC